MGKILMFGKGYATIVGYVLMAVGYVCNGFGYPQVGDPMLALGLVVGGGGVVRKKVAGL